MRCITRLALVALAALALLVAACVELTGQRITWFYDAPEDELRILIHYDGIHDSGSNSHGNGIAQIKTFLDAGDIMLLDWMGHLELEKWRKRMRKDREDERMVGKLLARVATEPVGWYREPNGRIGAAQLVKISEARAFVQDANELLNLAIQEQIKSRTRGLEEGEEREHDLMRTQKLFEKAAREGHEWIEIRGHSFRITVPVDASEWRRLKGEVLQAIFEGIVAGKLGEDDRRGLRFIVAALASAPISIGDRGHEIMITLGYRDRPTTLRMPYRDEYEPSLETTVKSALRLELDEALANQMLAEDPADEPAVVAVRDWGPPEERVRALLRLLGVDDESERKAARKGLADFAAAWKQERRAPDAPNHVADPKALRVAWIDWYGKVRGWPLDPKKLQSAAATEAVEHEHEAPAKPATTTRPKK